MRHTAVDALRGSDVRLGSIVLVAAGWAGAVPPPSAAKFWTAADCERVLHVHDYVLATADGHRFPRRATICVGTGGPRACKWTSDHRSRLYSQVQRLHALSLHRRRRSLVDARHTQRPRPRRYQASRRRPSRVATRLLHVPSQRQASCKRFHSGTLPLDRRPDRGPPYATDRTRPAARASSGRSREREDRHHRLRSAERQRPFPVPAELGHRPPTRRTMRSGIRNGSSR